VINDLDYIKNAQSAKSQKLPLHPFHGVYEITTSEELEEALKLMGITTYTGSRHSFGHEQEEEPYWEWSTDEQTMIFDEEFIDGTPLDKKVPYLVHYQYLCPWRADAFTKEGVEEAKGIKCARQCKEYLRIGYSPVHTYKCITLNQARIDNG